MGNFNLRGAFAGLLGEAGNQLTYQGSKMQAIEEQKLQLQMQERKARADYTRARSLEKFKYDLKQQGKAEDRDNEIIGHGENGKPWSRKAYEALPEDQRPELYQDGLKRPEPEKPQEPHKYSSDWGKIYSDRKNAGFSDEEAKQYADEAMTKTFKGKTGGLTEKQRLDLITNLRAEYENFKLTRDDGSSEGILGFGKKEGSPAPSFDEWVRDFKGEEVYNAISLNSEIKPKTTQNGTDILPQGNGEKLDRAAASRFLEAAGGNKDEARRLAKQYGWSY